MLVSEKYYLLNESEQLGILYCVMFSIGYIVHIWDKSIVSLFCILWNRLYNVTHNNSFKSLLSDQVIALEWGTALKDVLC